jgi:hypothetical protein
VFWDPRLNRAARAADDAGVRRLLARLKQAVVPPDGSSVAVRRALLAAQHARTPVELQVVPRGEEVRPILSCTIEQLREGDLVIGQPLIGGLNHPLAIGEELTLAFLSTRGRLRGRTRSLGRIRIPSGGARMLSGYRLAIPDELHSVERREHHRVRLGIDLAPEAELFTRFDRGPVVGVVEDLSIGGVKIRSRNARGKVAAGRRAYVKMKLPPPINEIGQMVSITRVEPGNDREVLLISLLFERQLPQLAEFIQEAQLRRELRQARLDE